MPVSGKANEAAAEKAWSYRPDGTRSGLASIRASVATIDIALVQKLRYMYGTSNVDHSAKVEIPNQGWAEMDAVAFSPATPGQPDIFEVKYAPNVKNVRNQIVAGLSQAARAASAMRGDGIVLIVVGDDARDAQLKEWSNFARSMANEYHSIKATLVIRYSEFIELAPDKFLQLLDINLGTLFG